MASTTGVVVLVPVKAFKQAKSRLVEIFPPETRSAMQERIGIALFEDFLEVLAAFVKKYGANKVKVVICSPDPAVKARVNAVGGNFVFLDETSLDWEDLNLAKPTSLDKVISRMNDYAVRVLGAKGTVLLMSDLPLLSVHSLVGLFKNIELKSGFKKVLLSPSMGNGCNMIARFPPNVIETRYSSKHGPSFIEHLALAKKKAKDIGMKAEKFIEVFKNLEIYLDLDTPDDLMNLYPLLKEVRPKSRLLSVLESINVEIKKRDSDDTRQVSIKVNMNPPE